MKSKQINEFASAIQSRIRFATFRELGRAPKIIRQGAKKKRVAIAKLSEHKPYRPDT